jgi:hypothetical protein
MPMAIEIRGFSEKVERGLCSTLKFKTARGRQQQKMWNKM